MNADHIRDSPTIQHEAPIRKEIVGRGRYVNNPYAVGYGIAALPPVTTHINQRGTFNAGGTTNTSTINSSLGRHMLPSMQQSRLPRPLSPTPPSHGLPFLCRPQVLKAISTTAPIVPSRQHTPFAMIAHKFDSQRYGVPLGVELAAGDVVVVDGDRGMNLGVVERIFSKAPHYRVENNVVRLASNTECDALHRQRLDEEAVCQDVQQLADNLSTNMAIRGIEYQFDRQKMTIFYSAPGVQVDFRRLQRVLYARYGCRIWIKDFKGEDVDVRTQHPEMAASQDKAKATRR